MLFRSDFLEVQDTFYLAKIEQSLQANKHRRFKKVYKVGNKVLLSTLHCRCEYMTRSDHRVAKFMIRYNGPYTVVSAHSESSVYMHLENK